jgi:hypothetical protein
MKLLHAQALYVPAVACEECMLPRMQQLLRHIVTESKHEMQVS